MTSDTLTTPKDSYATSLRVISYNIHKGFTGGRKRFVLKRIKRAIDLVHADLVFLQEVVGEHRRHARRFQEWPTLSQFEFLADRTWPHFAYGRNAVYRSGHHGNAILSRYPITEQENINISSHRFDQRGILQARVTFPHSNAVLNCLCTHLALFKRGRDEQIGRLCDLIETSISPNEPLVVAGDFNDWTCRVSNTLKQRLGLEEVNLSRNGRHVRTFPSVFPILPLDRIYVRNLTIRTSKVLTGAPWNRLSDHVALYTELEVPVPIEVPKV